MTRIADLPRGEKRHGWASQEFALSPIARGACIEAQIDTLYTEDMGAPITFDSLRLNNPFI